MKLSDLTVSERKALAEAVDSHYDYIYQCGAGYRQPSTDFAKTLVAADPRLTLAELRPDVWGFAPPVPEGSPPQEVA